MLGAWRLYPSALEPADCERHLRELLDSTSLGAGGVHGDNRVDRSIRRSRVGWPNRRRHAELLDKIRATVHAANRTLWSFDLDGHEEWQFTHYTHEDAGVYHTHMDCSLDEGSASCRKLSVVVNLSEPHSYAGGSLQLGAVANPDPSQLRARGTALVFPSFVEHHVTPLLAGERYSLVAWFSGPNWR
ncbi:MAG: 2OG-Fe(II) oxygenase [Acidobacteria bacterium]|nr:2OG-Fe(II) oxygenase [Acidobacteriota bacterium]